MGERERERERASGRENKYSDVCVLFILVACVILSNQN